MGIIVDPAFKAFAIPSVPDGQQDILFHIVEQQAFDLSACVSLFSSLPEGLWRAWSCRGDSYMFSLHDIAADNKPYRIAIGDRRLLDITTFSTQRDRRMISPLEYPLDELIISGHCNLNRIGILLHSALVSLQGRGLLFSGTSGSGKSTLSELWLHAAGAEVFTDDRVIVREKEEALWAYGTPWHGTAGVHQNKGAPIAAIFFIRHGSGNEVKQLSVMESANRLMVRCFPTFWHKEGIQFALDFCARIASSVACYEFGFVPDASAVEFIRKRFC